MPLKGDCVDWLERNPTLSRSDILSLPLIKPTKQEFETLSLSDSSIEADNQNSDFSKANLLLKLIDEIEFFHDEQKQPYAMFKNIDHQEIWPIESDEFKNWLTHQFWNTYKTSISHTSLNDVLSIIKGKATFEGECHQIFTRVGNFNDKIYINIANKKWQAIEVSANG